MAASLTATTPDHTQVVPKSHRSSTTYAIHPPETRYRACTLTSEELCYAHLSLQPVIHHRRHPSRGGDARKKYQKNTSAFSGISS